MKPIRDQSPNGWHSQKCIVSSPTMRRKLVDRRKIVDMEFVKSSKQKEDAHHKKCKGITKNTHLSHADNMAVHEQDTVVLRTQRGFRSFEHRIYTVMNMKIALSSVDDKLYRMDNNHGLPFGHYSLRQPQPQSMVFNFKHL